MTTKQHLSDDDLRQLVLEQKTDRPLAEIETHVSECTTCQSRLLSTAADESWRDEFISSVAELREDSAIDAGSGLTHITDAKDDDFELRTVRSMLEEILKPPMHPEMMGRLGRYDIESILGCGGMGVVLRAFDRDLHRPVAIKMVQPKFARNGTAKQRFAREARAAAAVLHPNVIGIHGIEETDGIPWFVMPLVAGPSLRQLVEQNGALPEREIVRVGMQIAAGLAAAHSQGLVHRDVKPENILIDNQVNRVVITDFGLARRESEESMTQTGLLVGTLNYMSPEQSRGGDLDGRSDLFSLGSLLFYLATGTVPFRSSAPMGVLNQLANEEHPRVQSLNPEISATLAGVIDRLLEKTPENRFQSASDLEAFLTDYLAHLNLPLQTPAPVLPAKTGTSHNKWLLTLTWVGAACVALIAGGVWLSNNWSARPQLTAGPAPTTSAKPGATWNEIKVRYELGEPGTFESQMSQLDRELSQIGQQLERSDIWDSPVNGETLNRFQHEIRQLDEALEMPAKKN